MCPIFDCFLDSFGTYKKALRSIFDQWSKLYFGLNVQPEIQTLKVVYCSDLFSHTKECGHIFTEKKCGQTTLAFQITLVDEWMSEVLGPHFLCWISGVVPFNTWLISSWENNKCSYKQSKCTKCHLFHSKWSKLSFWVKIVVILSVAHLVTSFIIFSAWDKSRVKWDNSRNLTKKTKCSFLKELRTP